eukprot:6208900-Pleurochrysis_carterae.AAC.4
MPGLQTLLASVSFHMHRLKPTMPCVSQIARPSEFMRAHHSPRSGFRSRSAPIHEQSPMMVISFGTLVAGNS